MSVGVLLALAWLVLLGPVLGPRAGLRHRFRTPSASVTRDLAAGRQPAEPAPGGLIRPQRESTEDELHRLPLLVHQLAGLLAAGRTPAELWADAARLSREDGSTGSSSPRTAALDAAARAAGMGLSPVPVFLAAAQEAAGDAFPAMVWRDLAACVDVSERSGAPLAGILARYAQELDAVLDSRAARVTAMSGPKATMRLLTWLPAAGLGMGYLLGGNPLAVLAGGPFGWLSGAAGLGLALAARIWSRALIRRAEAPGESR